jgi:hypothetical protein
VRPGGDSSDPRVTYLPIATDHSAMVKYNSANDNNYELVRDNIKAMVNEAVANHKRLEAIAEGDERPVGNLKRAKPLSNAETQGRGKGKGRRGEKRNVLQRKNWDPDT